MAGIQKPLKPLQRPRRGPSGGGEGVVVTAKPRLARYFVAHLSGNENAVRTIRELQEVASLQKLTKDDGTRSNRAISAALTTSFGDDTNNKNNDSAYVTSPSPFEVASTSPDLIEEKRKHNGGIGPFQKRLRIFIIRHYVRSIPALEDIEKAVNPKTSSVTESKIARLFGDHLGCQLNANRVIWDLQWDFGVHRTEKPDNKYISIIYVSNGVQAYDRTCARFGRVPQN